ncbi:MAG: hypothetical protein ABJF23_24000, partial [Bryobacteraceae bacterium]
ISSDAGFRRDARVALEGHIPFESVWDLGYDEVARLRGIDSDSKALIIIDFAHSEKAMSVARVVNGRPLISTIAVGVGGSRDDIVRLMHVGVRDVLPHFTYREVLLAAHRAVANLGCAAQLLADVYAFVPAKPGCGASTLATYASAMSADLSGGPALLLDFDIRLGVTSFLLKSEGGKPVTDALIYADQLDEDLWINLVSQFGNLQMLGSGPIDFSSSLPPESYSELLDFAVRRYSSVSVDLPGSMEQHECEVLLRAKRIFLVCTPDVGALHVARRKSSWLQDLQLADKVSVVLNSPERRSDFSMSEIEHIIQMPVRYQLPPSAKDISAAVQKGGLPASSSALAKQISIIAREMAVTKHTGKKVSAVRKLVDYFSISPARKVED